MNVRAAPVGSVALTWKVAARPTVVATGVVTGMRLGGVEVGSALTLAALGIVITGKVCDVVVLLVVSVAVTVTLVSVFAVAPVASI